MKPLNRKSGVIEYLGIVFLVACTPAATPTFTPQPSPPSGPYPAPAAAPTITPQPSPTSNPYTAPGARTRHSFDQVLPHLNTPSILVAFMRNNLRHGGGDYDQIHYGGNAYAAAQQVYANGEDDCDGLAEFGACVLSKHGFEAYNVGISVNSPLGHNVTGFVDPSDGKMYAINNGQEQVGPFNSWIELAQHFIDKKMAEPNKVIWLFAPCISQTTRDISTLPRKVIR